MRFCLTHIRFALLCLLAFGPVPVAMPLLASVLWTSTASASEGALSEIRFEGLRRVEPDAIRLVLSSREGEGVESSKITEDIRAIFAMGFFDDVKVYKTRIPAGLRLIYVVVEKPSIRKVLVRGNEEITTEDIKDIVDVRAFTIVREAQLKQNVEKIKELYVSKGYYLADVRYELEDLGNNEVAVQFLVDEHAKVEVKQIRFVGNQAFDDDDLKAGIGTREGDFLSFVTDSGTYRTDVFEVDLLRISSRYFDNGYINVKLGTPDVEISADLRHLYVTLTIEEGEQYSIGEIDFSGDIEDRQEQVREAVVSTKGEVFNRSQLGQDLMRLKSVYEDEGYAYANVTPVTSIDQENRLISITFDVQKGQKVYYERIRIVGNTKTRDKVIRRELRIYEGELSSGTQRERSRARVQRLGFFESVDIKTRKGSAENLQIVEIEVKERSTGTFQIGIGVSSVENFIANAQISQQNFLGRGQSISLSANVSALRQLISLQFHEPYLFDTDWSLSLQAFNIDREFARAFRRKSTGGSMTVGYPILDDLRVFLTYNFEYVRSSVDDGNDGRAYLSTLNSRGQISSVRATLSYDSRNDRLFPSSGMFHSASVEVSDSIIGASENRSFQRYTLNSRFYYPLPLGIVAKFAGRMGYIHAVAKEGLAPSELYILGGISDIRGYEDFTISPVRLAAPNSRGILLPDPQAGVGLFPSGGNKHIVFNIELEFPIFEQVGIKGVLFADAGNVYGEDENFFYIGDRARANQLDGITFDPRKLPLGMFWSVGFGFRWFSPIGPLRFEWGIPLTRRPSDGNGPLFHFTIGNAF